MPKQIAPQSWQAQFAQHPFFSGYHALARGFANLDDWPAPERLTATAQVRGLRNAANHPVRFEPQVETCGQRDYEAGILATGCVPTREANWHDFFNALVWLNLPHLKTALNAVQCDALGQHDTQRGARSDAATLFDESGAVLIGPDAELADRLRDHDWQGAFVERRAWWQRNHLLIVGHAVLEKALTPYPGIIAKTLYLPWPALGPITEAPPEGLDKALAEYWQSGALQRPADLFPIPVLGVPGMDPDNANPVYYDNSAVFRPKRERPARPSL